MDNQKVKKSKNKKFNWLEYILHGFSCIGCGTIILIIIIIALCTIFIFTISILSNTLSSQSITSTKDKTTSIQEDVISTGSSTDKIAIINITGVITSAKSSSLTSSGTNMVDDIYNALIYAEETPEIKQIILFIDSPGGGVVASDNIYRRVKNLAQKKTVTAYISSIGASGGYYIAVGANKIVMHQAGITGSIGVIMSITNYDQLYQKIGIREKVFKSGRFKNSAELFDGKSDDQLQKLYQNMLNDIYGQFFNVVLTNRPITKDKLLQIADGRIFGAKEAVKQKLIDEINTFDGVITQIRTDNNIDYEVVQLSSQFSFFDQLMKGYISIQQVFTGNIDNSNRLYYLYKD